MAPTGQNSMHNDAYATDAYEGGGPTGHDLTVTSATYGVVECATITFDSRGRIVGLCGGLQGFQLMLIDPDTLDATATMTTSERDATSGANPLTDLCGGAYFYLDDRDRAIVETTDGTVLVVKVTATGFGSVRTYDVTSAIPDGDCLIALMPDWDGRIWFVTKNGGVGNVDPATSEGPLAAAAGREDRQLLRHRRDRRGLRRERPRAVPLRRPGERSAEGHLARGLRPRLAAEAGPALAGLGHHADARSARTSW